jgi:hypothetical protein
VGALPVRGRKRSGGVHLISRAGLRTVSECTSRAAQAWAGGPACSAAAVAGTRLELGCAAGAVLLAAMGRAMHVCAGMQAPTSERAYRSGASPRLPRPSAGGRVGWRDTRGAKGKGVHADESHQAHAISDAQIHRWA